MYPKNVYWYLIQVIEHAELAPIYYEQYLQSNDDSDLHLKWFFKHMCSMGLAIILDYNFTFFPKEVKKILTIHRTLDKIKDLKKYTEIMLKFRLGTEQILIKEIKKNKLNPSTKRLDLILESTDSKKLALFKLFLNKANA
jgi:hypothetical protein